MPALLRMAAVLGGDNDTVPAGMERWAVSWDRCIKDRDGECIDRTIEQMTFVNPVAARRWARYAVRRGLFDFGCCTIQEERAAQAEEAPHGIGEWIPVGEPEDIP